MAKAALEQLHKLICSSKGMFPPGREAVVLQNLIQVTLNAAQAEQKSAHAELAELFASCAATANVQGVAVYFHSLDGRCVDHFGRHSL